MMRILYVEDNPFDADVTRRELRRLAPQLQLDVVDTLAAAHQRLAVSPLPYTGVLLDLRLPDGDGLVLLNHIRQQEMPLVVIILTGGGDEETAVSALKAGADDYIIKQGSYLADLPATLDNALQRFETGWQTRNRRLRVLYVERHTQDVDLTQRHLARHAPYIQLEAAATDQELAERFRNAETLAGYDVMLLDYSLGPINALDVVKQLSRQGRLVLPVVLVTGQGNEEVALQALKLGASDYVVKSPGYLYRLPSVLENAFHMAELEREQRALQESERRFRLLAENAQDTIFRYLVQGRRFEYVSPALSEMVGYAPEALMSDAALLDRFVHPDDLPRVRELLAGLEPPDEGLMVRWIHRDGRLVWTDQRFTFLKSAEGELSEIHGIVRDITVRRAIEEERDRMEAEKEEANRMLAESYERMIEGWALALELRDRETEGHSLRVAALTVRLAKAMGIDGEALNNVRRGALLHDIGKLGVPDSILKKPGPLNDEEWEVMRRHPAYAYQLLYPIKFLREAIEIPYGHHERWDGSGYPHGLKEEDIPLSARIFAVVDVWDSLSSNQPYRPAWDQAHIERFLREQSGIKFDPQVVSVMLDQILKL